MSAPAAPTADGSIGAAGGTPTAARLKRAVGLTLAAAVAVFAAHVLLFGALVDPGAVSGCTTGLYPGTYADLIVPAHLAMFAALAGLVAVLDAARSPGAGPAASPWPCWRRAGSRRSPAPRSTSSWTGRGSSR